MYYNNKTLMITTSSGRMTSSVELHVVQTMKSGFPELCLGVVCFVLFALPASALSALVFPQLIDIIIESMPSSKFSVQLSLPCQPLFPLLWCFFSSTFSVQFSLPRLPLPSLFGCFFGSFLHSTLSSLFSLLSNTMFALTFHSYLKLLFL